MLYSQLSIAALNARQKAWNITTSIHAFLELCELQVPDTGLNPRFYWTYADEDLVGTMVEVAEACHPKTVAATSMAKWGVLYFD